MLHWLQFDNGDGPVVETARHNEPRRIDDTTAGRRWPLFCRAIAAEGFGSLLSLRCARTGSPSAP
ncbi:MAG TPA: hypothetical protein VKV80_17455 [Streptosporangiaceae bacterium]|jgi:hypothetical protein|nr:hypothetical protein [Streptosporangiaceae bacterium]